MNYFENNVDIFFKVLKYEVPPFYPFKNNQTTYRGVRLFSRWNSQQSKAVWYWIGDVYWRPICMNIREMQCHILRNAGNKIQHQRHHNSNISTKNIHSVHMYNNYTNKCEYVLYLWLLCKFNDLSLFSLIICGCKFVLGLDKVYQVERSIQLI